MSTTDTSTPAKIAYDDIDDVIEAAARAKNEDAKLLSVEELQDIAAELDIPPHLVAPAVEEVRRRRQVELAAEQAATLRAQRRARAMQIGAGITATVLLVWGWSTHVALRDALLAVERQRSQVVNVIERRDATRAQWEGVADSPDKHAELSGAENRVRVERARYDELTTEYRREASSIGGRVLVTLGSHPDTLPLSSELEGW